MNADCVVVDANIAFKALAAGRGDLRLSRSHTPESQRNSVMSKRHAEDRVS